MWACCSRASDRCSRPLRGGPSAPRAGSPGPAGPPGRRSPHPTPQDGQQAKLAERLARHGQGRRREGRRGRHRSHQVDQVDHPALPAREPAHELGGQDLLTALATEPDLLEISRTTAPASSRRSGWHARRSSTAGQSPAARVDHLPDQGADRGPVRRRRRPGSPPRPGDDLRARGVLPGGPRRRRGAGRVRGGTSSLRVSPLTRSKLVGSSEGPIASSRRLRNMVDPHANPAMPPPRSLGPTGASPQDNFRTSLLFASGLFRSQAEEPGGCHLLALFPRGRIGRLPVPSPGDDGSRGGQGCPLQPGQHAIRSHQVGQDTAETVDLVQVTARSPDPASPGRRAGLGEPIASRGNLRPSRTCGSAHWPTPASGPRSPRHPRHPPRGPSHDRASPGWWRAACCPDSTG